MKTLTLTSTETLLNNLYPMPGPRMGKCRSLYHLASKVRSGVIVELGTYHGNGTVSLLMGSSPNIQVYTIDTYIDRTGWSGEKYKPEDEEQFWSNIAEAEKIVKGLTYRLTLLKDTVINAADLVGEGVELLFWDLGCMDTVVESVQAWEYRIMKGGVIAIHDTVPPRLGVGKALDWLDSVGYKIDGKVMEGGIWIARK